MASMMVTPADAERSARQLSLATTGLAPTDDVPAKATKGSDTPPAYAPCAACGAMISTGHTAEGHLVQLDTSVKTYCVRWTSGTPTPALCESTAYPIHKCEEATV